jgi:hypothetical protein
MARRNSCSVLAALTACILVGCIAIPVPVPPRGDIYTTESKLESLVDNRATKIEVTEQLGKPVKYRKMSMSYKACRKPFGVGWVILTQLGQFGYVRPERYSKVVAKCFELQLNFNQDGHLTGYQERPWPADFDFLQEDMLLKEFANEGDPVAAQLWLKAAPSADTPEVGVYEEAGIYCPNADLGHADAQVRIALIYDHGAYAKRVDSVRAWVWYSLATRNGDEAAKTRLSSLTDELTPEQLEEAKRQLAAWKPGQCMQDIKADEKETDDHVRKQFFPPPDRQSALYIYADTHFGPARPIYVDGELVGELAPMTYFYKVVTPGQHKISRKSESSNCELIVDTESGRNYFIRQYIKPGVFVSSANFELLPAEEGQKGIWWCKPAR